MKITTKLINKLKKLEKWFTLNILNSLKNKGFFDLFHLVLPIYFYVSGLFVSVLSESWKNNYCLAVKFLWVL